MGMKRLLALLIFNILMMGSAYAQAKADVQTLINTQVPITWQAGLSGTAMQNILTNILGTAFTPSGTVTITPPPGTATQGLVINQTAPPGPLTFPGFAYNIISISGDAQGVDGPDTRATSFEVDMTSGGTNEAGAKVGLLTYHIHNVATPANVNKGPHRAVWGVMQNDATDGGTNTGGGSAGQYIGMHAETLSINAATNQNLIIGLLAEVAVDNTSSTQYRWAVSAQDSSSGSSPQGVGGDAAYQMQGNNAVGFKNGLFLFGSKPLSTSGCVVCTDGSSLTITTGMDLSSYTISGNFLNGPSSLFTVSGVGALKAASFAAGANAGVSCAANTVVLATLVVSNGIVTHC